MNANEYILTFFFHDREESTYQKTPLIYAIEACDPDLVQYLLTSKEIDINIVVNNIFLFVFIHVHYLKQLTIKILKF